MNEQLERFLLRAESLVARIEATLPQALSAPDWNSAIAYRYRKRSASHGVLEPVRHIGEMLFDDLKEVDVQKEKIDRNTKQFVEGKSANNVLLTGARGTGKSSLIKACLNEYAKQGLHPGEGVEEKISLSERFGLWISFYPFNQDEYLAIVNQWLASFGVDMQSVPMARAQSLIWALERGSRSGRVAYQFARDFAGRR